MRILHVIPSVAEVRGGPSQAIVGMVQALNEIGIDAEIATTNDNGTALLDVPLNRIVDFKGVPVRFFPRFSPPLRAIREFAYSSSLARWLESTIPTYDVVHVHALFSFASTYAMTVSRKQGVPYINRPLGLLNEWSLTQSAGRKLAYLKLIERANLNGSSALHFTARAEQREVAELGLTSPGFVLPLGLNLATEIPEARRKLHDRLEITKSDPVLLFLSRIHPKKGLDLLIPALDSLRDIPFTFVLAGNGEPAYERHIDELIERYHLTYRCRRTGFVQGEMKNLLLQGADLFLLPSHSENFGIVVVEALAAGLPLIVTPGVALASLVREKSFGLVVDQTREALAEGIRQFFSDSRWDDSWKSGAKRFVREEFSWSAVAKKLAVVYEAIGTRQAPPHFSAYW